MVKLMAALVAVATLVKNNPALAAALVNLGVLLASYFGLHITGDQLIYVTGVATLILGTVVRALVTPTHKVPAPVTNVTNVVHMPPGTPPAEMAEVLAKEVQKASKPRAHRAGAHPANRDANDVATQVMNPVRDVHPKNGIDKPV